MATLGHERVMKVCEKEWLQQQLLGWFRGAGRSLPWRTTYDPYHVWISEVMLQQTQMERGVAYFCRWIERFPDIEAVAVADQQEILKYWEGLGYYSRARNLHKTAQLLLENHGGIVPCEPEILRTLPGVGPYTAAAIASIACNLDIAVVDANVVRVYARLFDIEEPLKTGAGRKRLEGIARGMLPAGKARLYNQALMDFGALVCLPKSPRCDRCPVARSCRALAAGTVGQRPLPTRASAAIQVEMATGILGDGCGRLFIQQRLADDVWGGLWEFPGGRLKAGETPEEAVVREFREETGFAVQVCRAITTVRHSYTRYRVTLHCFGCRLVTGKTTPRLTAAQDYRWLPPQELHRHGFPAGHRKILEYLNESCPDLLDDPCAGGRRGNQEG